MRAIIERVRVEIISFGSVDESLAWSYGEGGRTLSWWRSTMEEFYRKDKGCFRTEDIAACEKAGLTPYAPQRGSSASHGFFCKDEFRYDTERDAYTCPGSHELKPFRFGKLRDTTKIDYTNQEACGILSVASALHGRRLSRRFAFSRPCVRNAP